MGFLGSEGVGVEKLRKSAGHSTGRQVCESTTQRMGMSGTPLEMSHREGIRLDVTMNRKPSPPPEPTQAFDVRRVTWSHRSSEGRGGGGVHSYPESLATSLCHARPVVCCAPSGEEKKKTTLWIDYRSHRQQTASISAYK